MSNFFKDNDDLAFYYEKGIDWAPLVEVTEYGYRTHGGFKAEGEAVAFYREVAETVGELAADEIATRSAAIDREEVRLQGGEVAAGPAMAAIFERIRAMDLHRLCLPRELHGLNAPLLTYFVNIELIARADVSVVAHHSFHGGMALAMLAYSLSEGTTTFDVENACIQSTRFGRAIDEVARGDAWGSMDITEPNAGSDMAALRTVAEQDANGQWFVSGQKIFITSGHGKYHFVIARTESAPRGDDPLAGLGGLSMFLVKAYEDRPDGARARWVTIDRVEEKLGQHGSVTASLLFDRAPAELIGKRGEGFKCMLLLMNNARLGVGFESIGLCEAAYRMAKAYAEERRSMGKPVARHEMIADYLDEMRTDIQGLRALAMYGAFHEEMSQKLRFLESFARGSGKAGEGMASPEEMRRIHRTLPVHVANSRRVTPLLKYLAAEKAVEMARRAVQIHGGAGYTRDYGAEKLLRDAMVMPIYEGTSQIQALMAMKDQLVALVRKPHAFVARVAQTKWQKSSARDPLERRVAGIKLLALSGLQHLAARTAVDKLRSIPGQLRGKSGVASLRRALGGWNPKRDFALAMLHAERITRILADEAICDVLLEQAQKFPERREVLERYVERAELRCHALHREITTTGDRILADLEPSTKTGAAAAGPNNPARDTAPAAAE